MHHLVPLKRQGPVTHPFNLWTLLMHHLVTLKRKGPVTHPFNLWTLLMHHSVPLKRKGPVTQPLNLWTLLMHHSVPLKRKGRVTHPFNLWTLLMNHLVPLKRKGSVFHPNLWTLLMHHSVPLKRKGPVTHPFHQSKGAKTANCCPLKHDSNATPHHSHEFLATRYKALARRCWGELLILELPTLGTQGVQLSHPGRHCQGLIILLFQGLRACLLGVGYSGATVSLRVFQTKPCQIYFTLLR